MLELRGILKTEAGNPTAALVDFDRAILRGASISVRVPRALALMAAGKNDAAVRDWSVALDEDAENAEAYLGRATALIRLNRADRALVDLDQAADWATGGTDSAGENHRQLRRLPCCSPRSFHPVAAARAADLVSLD